MNTFRKRVYAASDNSLKVLVIESFQDVLRRQEHMMTDL